MKTLNFARISSIILLLFLLFSNTIFSNTLFGGIEIGSKGVKITVIDVENAKKNLFTLKEFWTENVGIAKGISIDGNLGLEDIDTASKIVFANFVKLSNEYHIDVNNIFIVASSGVGLAKNTDVLTNKIKELTKKDMEIISSKLEAKLLFRGSIAQKFYNNSLILDIGGGNTKGGFIENYNGDNSVFFPLNLDFGTVTLTEKINKKVKNQNDIVEYSDLVFSQNKDLSILINKMYDERSASRKKVNVYMSGGAVWAFFTLTNGLAKDNFAQFTYGDVQYYDAFLKNNFKKFEDLASTDKEVEKVLKTYSQKYLITANDLLLKTLENLGDIESKKLYFVKQGQIAWLLSYVADSAKGAKPVY